MTNRLRIIALVLVATTRMSGQGAPTPATPHEAITAIVDAFATHDVVVLGEGPHGNLQGHAFRLSLLRDPRFAATVNDIVVEFGSGRYQDRMDRFIAGADVDAADLRHAWQDTTVVTPVWDVPIYEEFFRSVREINRTRPSQRLRVLLGDAPIDWRTTRTRDDVHRWGLQKGRHTVEVIRREVLARHRKALVIYGDSHFQGRGVTDSRLPINILERGPDRARVYTIAPVFRSLLAVQGDMRQWPVPSLAAIQGTVIGGRPLASVYPIPPAPGWNTLKLEDEYDAILFMGDVNPTMSQVTKAQCEDAAYMKMRLGRMALDVPQARQARIDGLKQICAALIGK